MPVKNGMRFLVNIQEFVYFIKSMASSKCEKDDFDVATGVKYGVASFSSCSKSICDPKSSIMRNRGSPKTIASCQN